MHASPIDAQYRQLMRILIIDDDDVVRELLSSTLKRGNHHVVELATAIGATRAIFEHDIDAQLRKFVAIAVGQRFDGDQPYTLRSVSPISAALSLSDRRSVTRNASTPCS